ncbi:MAG: bifunctional glutamate N-acetyltransferase/amino-acid acetyltransferase ArgJ [Planctomycetes bacterium]|nr:bifunctional glutamate N-acetyltransferase/amino-acid acetyltransferase ArgJ [Planctomycetota bacterium]
MPESVVLPRGFRAAGHACGIKQGAGALDLALFVADRPATAAGVFTQNRVVGAPVKVSRSRVPRATARAVVINSGNANACTGEQGLEDARWMTASIARELGCGEDDVLVCSTGVIGRFLPRDKLQAGLPAVCGLLGEQPTDFESAARGMMTTDTVPKLAMRRREIGDQPITVSGAAKGAAMIGPNMATMLAVVMTDAALSPEAADRLLRRAVDRSFNCISVEGHTSTSDSVILLASGAADSSSPANGGHGGAADEEGPIADLLTELCVELAQKIVRDAEGAAHFVTIDVRGLRTDDEARRIAKAIADGPLVKTAIAGNDPNWGRIISAAGYAGVDLREEDMTLRLNGILLYESGSPVAHDAAAVSKAMSSGQVHIELELPLGEAQIRFWTSDLTTQYVRLNADYTT